MNDVKRYTAAGSGVMRTDEKGGYVNYSDYLELKAEVERLRKAGDEMHRAIKVSDPILDWKIELWNAAKEGKQS